MLAIRLASLFGLPSRLLPRIIVGGREPAPPVSPRPWDALLWDVRIAAAELAVETPLPTDQLIACILDHHRDRIEALSRRGADPSLHPTLCDLCRAEAWRIIVDIRRAA